MRHYSVFDLLIEFKYVPLNKLGGLTGQEVRQKNQSELIGIDKVKAEQSEARKQLREYRQTLTQK